MELLDHTEYMAPRSFMCVTERFGSHGPTPAEAKPDNTKNHVDTTGVQVDKAQNVLCHPYYRGGKEAKNKTCPHFLLGCCTSNLNSPLSPFHPTHTVSPQVQQVHQLQLR